MSIDPKYSIAELEVDLHESQFTPWDVETFLADRHRAKIEALTAPKDKWQSRVQVVKELGNAVFIYIGQIATIAVLGNWLLTGDVLP